MKSYPFRNLVFEGGGVKGIGYVGALKMLETKGIYRQIKRVAGTSAGAIMALLVGLDYTLDEINQIFNDLDFNNFLDDSWGVQRDINRLVNDYGWYKGNYFREWSGNLIKAKTGNSNATFNDIRRSMDTDKECGYRDMYFVGTNLSTGFSEIFSAEHTPRECIADAVRISMSIPLFFAACKGLRGDVYVDGGVLDNYPIRIFDRKKYVEQSFQIPGYYSEHNAELGIEPDNDRAYVRNGETLGFRLDSGREIGVFRDHAEPARNDIDDFFSYMKSLVFTIMESQQNQHLNSEDWSRTVYIDTLGVSTTDFGITAERKAALIVSGEDGTENYFNWYDKQNA